MLNNLRAVGIRVKLRPLERAAFFKGYGEKAFKNIIQGASGAFGNTATRLEAFVVKGGAYSYGNYPDIDALFAEQAVQMDLAKRTATLHRLQQLVHEKAIFAPIYQQAFISGVGPPVEQSGFGLIKGFPYTAPYEDLTVKGKITFSTLETDTGVVQIDALTLDEADSIRRASSFHSDLVTRAASETQRNCWSPRQSRG